MALEALTGGCFRNALLTEACLAALRAEGRTACGTAPCRPAGRWSTCLAIPRLILGTRGEDPLIRAGRADFGRVVREVKLAFVPEVEAGVHVLVHVGVAIAVIDAAEAARLLVAPRALARPLEAP